MDKLLKNVVKHIQIVILLLTFIPFYSVFAQKTIITGKVTDSETGEPIPFANVHFKGSTSNGTTTNFDGFFKLVTDVIPSDSLVASFVGYSARAKFVEKNKAQFINFQLASQVTTLQAVVISAKNYENPAWDILRNVIKNKDRNDPRYLDAYAYESYSAS